MSHAFLFFFVQKRLAPKRHNANNAPQANHLRRSKPIKLQANHGNSVGVPCLTKEARENFFGHDNGDFPRESGYTRLGDLHETVDATNEMIRNQLCGAEHVHAHANVSTCATFCTCYTYCSTSRAERFAYWSPAIQLSLLGMLPFTLFYAALRLLSSFRYKMYWRDESHGIRKQNHQLSHN